MTTTTFYALFQGDHADHEGDATCLAVFSTEKKANDMQKLLSDKHTELKREANEFRSRRTLNGLSAIADVPDLYWDVRPIPFDPRSLGEL